MSSDSQVMYFRCNLRTVYEGNNGTACDGKLQFHVFRHYRSDVDAHTHAEIIKAVFVDIGQLLADPQSVIRHSNYVLKIPHVAGVFR